MILCVRLLSQSLVVVIIQQKIHYHCWKDSIVIHDLNKPQLKSIITSVQCVQGLQRSHQLLTQLLLHALSLSLQQQYKWFILPKWTDLMRDEMRGVSLSNTLLTNMLNNTELNTHSEEEQLAGQQERERQKERERETVHSAYNPVGSSTNTRWSSHTPEHLHNTLLWSSPHTPQHSADLM